MTQIVGVTLAFAAVFVLAADAIRKARARRRQRAWEQHVKVVVRLTGDELHRALGER